MAKYKLVLIDRSEWFLPEIEQEEFSRIGGEVLVGCARLGGSKELDPATAKAELSATVTGESKAGQTRTRRRMAMRKSLLATLVLVGAMALLALSPSAEAGASFPKMVLKFGHSAQPTQNNAKGVVKFAELVKERTGGAVEIQVYPASQLGSDVAVMEQVKAGLVHFTFNGPDQLSSYPEWGPAAVLNMPYILKGNSDREQYESLRKLVRGPLMKEVNETGGRATNLYMLDMAWWFGNLYLTTKTKRIVHPDDLNGLKIRTRDTH